MIDNIILFAALLVVTGVVLKAVVRHIDNQEKVDSSKKHKLSHR